MASSTPPAGKAKSEPIKQESQAMSPLPVMVVLQRAASAESGEQRLNVRLLIDGSDADGIRHYDEELPVSLVRAILNPQIADFFIPIKGNGRSKPPRTKSHWLHTGYIREVLLLDELPD